MTELSKTQQLKRLRAVLEATYPQVFSDPPKPLAIGIHTQIRKELPDIDKNILKTTLYRWCARKKYQELLGQPRVNLDGSVQTRAAGLALLGRKAK